MGNGKNKFLVIALISILALTAGCGITITRNKYYSCSDQSKKPNQDEARSYYPSGPLTNKENEQNR